VFGVDDLVGKDGDCDRTVGGSSADGPLTRGDWYTNVVKHGLVVILALEVVVRIVEPAVHLTMPEVEGDELEISHEHAVRGYENSHSRG
jgi:hypothetical protein